MQPQTTPTPILLCREASACSLTSCSCQGGDSMPADAHRAVRRAPSHSSVFINVSLNSRQAGRQISFVDVDAVVCNEDITLQVWRLLSCLA